MRQEEHPPKVFITGYGAVSAFVSATGEGYPTPDTAAAAGTAPDGERPLAAFAPEQTIPMPLARRMDRFTQIAYVAVMRALAHARFDPRILDEAARARIGIVLNTCYGPFESTTGYLEKVLREGAKKAPAAVFPNTVYNAFTGKITIDLGIYGTNSTVSGSNPLLYGFDMIRQGYDDAVIVGGCEELSPKISRGFRASGYLGEQGFTLGEGASVVVLESEAMARRRGVEPLAEVCEYGLTQGIGEFDEAFPCDEEGLRVAMGQALGRGGVEPAAVDFVSANANGHAGLDAVERHALDAFFAAATPRVDTAKRFVGETFGAAAGFGTIFAVEALRHDTLQTALVNNIEYGGACTSLLVRRAA